MAPDATVTNGYVENLEAVDLYRDHLWRFMDDPSAPVSIWNSTFRAAGIGWMLPWQGRNWLDSAYYREIEAPLDSCWFVDAWIADGGRTIGALCLTRPRGARPFTGDDVQRLDRLRPWLAHAIRPQEIGLNHAHDQSFWAMAGAAVASGQMVLTADATLVFQTPGIESLLLAIAGEPNNCTRYVPARDRLSAPVLELLRRITGAANGTSNTPPRMQLSSAYGVVTLEAKWLLPAGTLAAEVANDPKGCLISVTIEVREHAVAHAARALRESGATPRQTKVGIGLALGKTKPAIADELGIQLSSLYQTLDVHNSTELATKIWLG